MARAQTKEVLQQVESLAKSIKVAPSSSKPGIAVKLEQTCDELAGILGNAWEFCDPHGPNAENTPAFDRFVEILSAYERGSDALLLYRSSAASFGAVA